MFSIEAVNRAYDLHRPKGCTVLAIEVEHWPGNQFGLWLPKTVHVGEDVAWCNWSGDTMQHWEASDTRWVWSKRLKDFTVTSTLDVDEGNACVGIACRNFRFLFNNNDCILRCLHSEPFPIETLPPRQSAAQEGVILFAETGHDQMRERFEALTVSRWGADTSSRDDRQNAAEGW